MSTLSELLARHTQLPGAAVGHLQRIVAEWQLLADLAFANLLMWAPLDVAARPEEFLCVAHVRPTTGPTVHPEDMVGTRADDVERLRLRQALLDGSILREDQPCWQFGVPVRREVVPVRL